MQSSADADVDIVLTATNPASIYDKTIAVVADDTDILVLFLHDFCFSMADVFFVRHAKKSYSIRSICSRLGHDICQQLLVIDAIGGCDTTSALYGIGGHILD